MIFRNGHFPLIKRAIALCFVLQLAFLFMPYISHAQVLVPKVTGLGSADLVTIIVNIIQLVLGFLGLIALVIVLLAGFKWMTSGGNDDKIGEAKKLMKSGVIGLLIILSSYIIASFVMDFLTDSTSNNGSQGGVGYGEIIGGDFGSGALGGGVLESHYPERDSTNIPRNTMIMISFKIPIATSTIISGDFSDGVGESLCNTYTNNNSNGNSCGKLNSNIEITNGGQAVPQDDVVIVLQSDGKSILIDPIILLGSPSTNSNIIVHLQSGINSSEGKPIFGGLAGGYSWNFETSTFSDTTPPRVVSVWPVANSNVSRNAIVQINFSEPINILSIPGNIIASSSGASIPGLLKISNKYKTVEFFSLSGCGGLTRNSCGEEVFCFPGNSSIDMLVKSGNLTDLLSGINDSCGNFLDGNSDNASTGFPEDDYDFSFTTDDTINITAPSITSVSPLNGASTISVDTPVSATFDKVLSSSSINSDNFYIYKFDGTTGVCGEFLDGKKANISVDCFPNFSASLENLNTAKLRTYSPYLDKNFTYRPRVTSSIRDSYGNCFKPAEGPGRSDATDSPQQ